MFTARPALQGFLRTSRPRVLFNCQFRCYSAQPSTAPLNVLFFGSDEFSMPSLDALYQEHKANPSLIASLCVCHRRTKEVTRKGKQLMTVPIHEYALKLSLPTIGLDAFPTNFPIPENCLIVTASFGVFIPKRVLALSPFPGLNVHPSLLPQLRGAAPIHWAILQGLKETGVSVQTMSTVGFDKGLVLNKEAVPMDKEDYVELRDKLATVGARLLLDVIRSGEFRNMKARENEGNPPPADGEKLILAPRTSKTDQRVNWATMGKEQILRMQRAFETVWTRVDMGNPLVREPLALLDGVQAVDYEATDAVPGEWRYLKENGKERMLVRCKDGWVRVGRVKLERKNWTEAGEWARNKKMHGKDLFFERTWSICEPSEEKAKAKAEQQAKKSGTSVNVEGKMK